MDPNDNCFVCQAPKVTGFEGVKPGRNLELDPTLTGQRTDQRGGFPDGPLQSGDEEADLGLTARWGITPNLTFSGAVNPDFSQVEADAVELDVDTQFALFFPEKRPFFLEAADFFQTPFNAVYTRTVADPRWGAKLTGKVGKNAIGFFVAEDDRTNLLLPGDQFSRTATLEDLRTTDAALRYRRDIGTGSTLGARSPTGKVGTLPEQRRRDRRALAAHGQRRGHRQRPQLPDGVPGELRDRFRPPSRPPRRRRPERRL